MLKLLINNGDGKGLVDYTRYVVPASIDIEDSISTPTLTTFTLTNADQAFKVPVRSAYVALLSTLSPLSVTGAYLATGFITNEIQRKFLGMSGRPGSGFGFQHYEYDIKVTSDEYLLNTKAVPFIAAYINQTMGQILISLANTLAPGFFDTTNVQAGDLIPFFQYDPQNKWSDTAKQFSDQAQYHYKVIGKKIYFVPFGDAPLGISYDETKQTQKNFNPSALDTGVLSIPLVNDCIVIGEVEPQQMRDDYFVGDGFTGNFKLKYNMFHGTTDLLLQDDWTENALNQGQWALFDPFGQVILAGALNTIANAATSGALGLTYLLLNNGIELGGHLVIQHGEIQFNDASIGIIGGLYQNTAPGSLANPGACIAGFNISNTANVTLTASGANGIQMQPMISGALVGTPVVSVQNHHYVLQTYITAKRWSRYNQIYRTLAGTPWGDQFLPALAEVTFTITDIDLAQAYNVATLNNPYVPAYTPNIIRYTQAGVALPSFAAYVLLNSQSLNITLNYTMLWQPPQASLLVNGLTGARPTNVLALTGGQLPLYDPNDPLAMQNTTPIGPAYVYPMGFGINQDITATVAVDGDTNQLQFYSDRIPGVGARIKLQAWQAGHAISRVQDPVSIAREATIVGDNGLRSAIITDLKPDPRTSDECDLAAAAVILDRENPQFDGTYTIEGKSAYGSATDTYFWDPTAGFPWSGRYFNVTAPQRNISGQTFLVRQMKTSILEMYQEVYMFQISFGQDLYLEKLLRRFVDSPANITEPTETANPPNPQNLPAAATIFTTYLDNLPNAKLTLLTGTQVFVDLGAAPITGVEVRRSDTGWASNTQNLYGIFTTQTFILPRSGRDQSWYMRQVNGKQTSRFTRVLRVNYPMVPLPPSSVSVNFAVPLAPVVSVSLPTNFDPNIYGVEIDGSPTGTGLTGCSQITLVSDDPNDHRTAIVVGYLCPNCVCGPNKLIMDTLILNGTTPVTTPDSYGQLLYILIYGGLQFADQMTMSDGFAYLLGPTGTPTYLILQETLVLDPDLGMKDNLVLLLSGPQISLLLGDQMVMHDSAAKVLGGGPSDIRDSMNFWVDNVLLALRNAGGGSSSQYLLIINEPMMDNAASTTSLKDGVATIGLQIQLTGQDQEGGNWSDAFAKTLA